MHGPHRSDLNARGRLMAARRHNEAAQIWRATHVGPRLGFFCRLRDSFGQLRRQTHGV